MSVGHSRRSSRRPSATGSGLRRERLLQVALDAVLLEPGRLAHLVLDVREHLEQPDLEPVLAASGALADDEHVAAVLEHRRRRHPVERLVAAGVGVDEHRAVGLHHQQPRRLRAGRRSAGRCRSPRSGRRSGARAAPYCPFRTCLCNAACYNFARCTGSRPLCELDLSWPCAFAAGVCTLFGLVRRAGADPKPQVEVDMSI